MGTQPDCLTAIAKEVYGHLSSGEPVAFTLTKKGRARLDLTDWMVWGGEDPADYRISVPKARRVKVKHKPTGETHVIDTTRDDDEQLVEVVRLLHEIAIGLEEEAGGQYQTVTMKWALKAIAMHTDLDNEPTDIDGLIEFFDYPLSRCAVVFSD